MQPSVRYMRGDMVVVVVLRLTLYRGPTFKFRHKGVNVSVMGL
jgi:hypothetical protein